MTSLSTSATPRRRRLLGSALVGLTLAAGAALAAPGTAGALPLGDGGELLYCEGLPATVVGTEGADVILGTAGDDVIVARGGDDLVRAGGGHDTICLGAGNDTAYGHGGDDVIRGGHGNDNLQGGSGIDLLMGDAGGDLLDGEAGGDYLYGGDGSDWLLGRQGRDHFHGGAGKDTIDAATDDDGQGEEVNGGSEDDLIFADDGGPGADTVRGDGGTDTCHTDLVDVVLTCELGGVSPAAPDGLTAVVTSLRSTR